VRAELSDALAKGTIHALRRSPDRYIAEAPLARLASRAPVEIQALAAAGAGAVGASRRTLLQRLVPGADPRWAEAIEAALVARGSIVLAGEEARVPGRDELPATERDLASRIAGLYSERALDPPSPAEAATVLNHRQKVVEGLIGYLVKRGSLVRLPGGWIVSKDAVDAVASRLRGSGRASVDVGEFKEMFKLTRKLAIPLLEHLDSSKVTRRVGDRREIGEEVKAFPLSTRARGERAGVRGSSCHVTSGAPLELLSARRAPLSGADDSPRHISHS